MKRLACFVLVASLASASTLAGFAALGVKNNPKFPDHPAFCGRDFTYPQE